MKQQRLLSWKQHCRRYKGAKADIYSSLSFFDGYLAIELNKRLCIRNSKPRCCDSRKARMVGWPRISNAGRHHPQAPQSPRLSQSSDSP